MTDAVFLIARFQTWIYLLLVLIALIYLRALGRAQGIIGRAIFGLEKEAALQRRNAALTMLLVLGLLAAGVYLIDGYVVPSLNRASPEVVLPTPVPSPTPIRSGEGLVVDSSGCDNPDATLSDPGPKAVVSGSYEVRGTANIENFAFYKFEISGQATSGAWVPLFVSTEPVVNGTLGTFDSSAYPPAEYALRLVVSDSAGNFPFPCVVPVTVVGLAPDSTAP